MKRGGGSRTCLRDREPASADWAEYRGHCHGRVSETGAPGKTMAGTQDPAALRLPSQQWSWMSLSSCSPPPCSWGQEEPSCRWKPAVAYYVVGTILLRVSSPAHSRLAILLAGLFRGAKLQFCYGNSMSCCSLLMSTLLKSRWSAEGKSKDTGPICIYFTLSYFEMSYA